MDLAAGVWALTRAGNMTRQGLRRLWSGGFDRIGQFSLTELRRWWKLSLQRPCGWQKSAHGHGGACAASHAMSPLKGLKPTNQSVSCD